MPHLMADDSDGTSYAPLGIQHACILYTAANKLFYLCNSFGYHIFGRYNHPSTFLGLNMQDIALQYLILIQTLQLQYS